MMIKRVSINPKNYYKPSESGGPEFDAEVVAEFLKPHLENLSKALVKKWDDDFDAFVKELLEATLNQDDTELSLADNDRTDGPAIILHFDGGNSEIVFDFNAVVDDAIDLLEFCADDDMGIDGIPAASFVKYFRDAADKIEMAIQKAYPPA